MHIQIPLLLRLFIQLPRLLRNMPRGRNLRIILDKPLHHNQRAMDTLWLKLFMHRVYEIVLAGLAGREGEQVRERVLVQAAGGDKEGGSVVRGGLRGGEEAGAGGRVGEALRGEDREVLGFMSPPFR